MPVETLACGDVVTVSTDAEIQEIATMMHEESVGSVVITDGSEPVGIVTDRDLAIQVIANGESPDGTTAGEIMSDAVQTIDSDEGFYRATELMSEHGIRRLPVVDSNYELTGILTVDDLNELLAGEH